MCQVVGGATSSVCVRCVCARTRVGVQSCVCVHYRVHYHYHYRVCTGLRGVRVRMCVCVWCVCVRACVCMCVCVRARARASRKKENRSGDKTCRVTKRATAASFRSIVLIPCSQRHNTVMDNSRFHTGSFVVSHSTDMTQKLTSRAMNWEWKCCVPWKLPHLVSV